MVYYQCCVLIGGATTRLCAIAHQQPKELPLKTETMAVQSRFAEVLDEYYIFLTNQLDFTKTIISLALVPTDSITHSANINSQPIRAQGINVKYVYCNFNPYNSKPRKIEAIFASLLVLFFVILRLITRGRFSLLRTNEPQHFAPEDYILFHFIDFMIN